MTSGREQAICHLRLPSPSALRLVASSDPSQIARPNVYEIEQPSLSIVARGQRRGNMNFRRARRWMRKTALHPCDHIHSFN